MPKKTDLNRLTYEYCLLEGFGGNEKKIAHNTTVRKYYDEKGTYFAVKYHKTDIVRFYSTFLEFTLGGWATSTTIERVNRLVRKVGIFRKRGNLFVRLCTTGKNIPISSQGTYRISSKGAIMEV
jgi:hypothetical protein